MQTVGIPEKYKVAWRDCKKCPKFLCMNYHDIVINKQLFYLFSSKEFTLFPACRGIGGGEKFQTRLYDKDYTWHSYDTLYEAIDALLSYKYLQLEDALRLTRIKSEL